MAKYRAFTNASDFAMDLDRAAQVLGIESAQEAAVTIALALDDKITAGTPVDTGRARANWFVSEGAPRTDTTESTTPEQRPQLTGRAPIYVTNSLPYIVPLEFGHSKQAPHGMVRKALAEVAASINAG